VSVCLCVRVRVCVGCYVVWFVSSGFDLRTKHQVSFQSVCSVYDVRAPPRVCVCVCCQMFDVETGRVATRLCALDDGNNQPLMPDVLMWTV